MVARDTFFGPDGRRAIEPEIVGHLEEMLGATPVLGFDRMIDVGDARVGSQRIAGFAERHDLREWLLPLSAQGGLVWHTQPVPLRHAGHIAILLSLGFGNGSPLPQPSGQFDIYVNERYTLSCRMVYAEPCFGARDADLVWEDAQYQRDEPSSYHVRVVQVDRESAWSSPIWVG